MLNINVFWILPKCPLKMAILEDFFIKIFADLLLGLYVSVTREEIINVFDIISN